MPKPDPIPASLPIFARPCPRCGVHLRVLWEGDPRVQTYSDALGEDRQYLTDVENLLENSDLGKIARCKGRDAVIQAIARCCPACNGLIVAAAPADQVSVIEWWWTRLLGNEILEGEEPEMYATLDWGLEIV